MSWAMGFMASLVDTSILALALHREHISRYRAAGSIKVKQGPENDHCTTGLSRVKIG